MNEAAERAIRRLWPAIERCVAKHAFTADGWPLVEIDLNTIRAAIANQPVQPAMALPDLPVRGYQNLNGWCDDAMRDYGRACALAALNAAPQGPNSDAGAK